eukprot:2261231-Alexandrium_andersonii.AAC.1
MCDPGLGLRSPWEGRRTTRSCCAISSSPRAPWIAEDCDSGLMASSGLIYNSVLGQRANPGFRHIARASNERR